MNDRSEKRIELILIGNCLYLYFIYLERDGFLLLGFCDTFFSSSFLFFFFFILFGGGGGGIRLVSRS